MDIPEPNSPDLEFITVRVVPSIHEVDATQWDECARQGTPNFNPFVRHAFYSALEDSGSVTHDSGWQPQHVAIETAEGALLACAAMYLKDHSYGEYVFDWGWANAYERAGGHYYPKLQCAVPFAPVTGPRLMVRPDTPGFNTVDLKRMLLTGMIEVADRQEVSSLHITFPDEEDTNVMAAAGLLERYGQQFHWKNDGYQTFDDFLDALSSRKRKNIRKEREKAKASGVTIYAVSGDDITSKHWDAFYRFYRLTSDRKWGQAYMTRSFFELLSERMGDQVVLIMGEEDGEIVCGALNLLGGDTLYGRNWGTVVHYPMLHFEVCYYRAIDFAIEKGLKWVEAGAQGPHKLQRGYLPRKTYSAHWISDGGFRAAVSQYLGQERPAIEEDVDTLTELGPFKRTGRASP
ncbi:MAG: N-acetyltransferase [Rhodospirillaceae bacterium]|nr:N-acetyltransferase [Rhodospirillaceae bacterium]MBT5564778.1 N-acetyltransferase [Rhodospirillaceae bacterium]MBT6087961.1 N-acetyltransferase [Rhodospirillaceae bacterium]